MFVWWCGIHFIRFLLVHDYMLQEVFSGVGDLWKEKHLLQVTFPVLLSNFYLVFVAMLFSVSGIHVHLCFLFLVLAVLDTAAGVWLDRNGIVSSSRSNKGHDHDPALELMRRCRHAAAAVGVQIYIHGGLRGGNYSYYGRWSCIVELRVYFDLKTQMQHITLQ